MTQRRSAAPHSSRPQGFRAPTSRKERNASHKTANVLVCEDCGIYQHKGTWHAGSPPLADLHPGLCPACQRVRSGIPAGTLRLPARFLTPLAEVVNLIQNCESAERAEHPLERLMALQKQGESLLVTTTGVHLARRLAHKLERRFHAAPRFDYADGADEVRVAWDD